MKNSEIPMGFSMALPKNIKAMQYFSALTQEKQQNIIKNTHNIHSKNDMQEYVNSLINNY